MSKEIQLIGTAQKKVMSSFICLAIKWHEDGDGGDVRGWVGGLLVREVLWGKKFLLGLEGYFYQNSACLKAV